MGPAHPPGMGPGSRSGCFGLPNLVLGSTHGLRASAWAFGAGPNALRVVCGNVEAAGSQSPGRFLGGLPGGFPLHAEVML